MISHKYFNKQLPFELYTEQLSFSDLFSIPILEVIDNIRETHLN